MCPSDDGHTCADWSPGPDLALPSSLVHRTMWDAILCTPAIRLVVSLPSLRELQALELEPDCDLSVVACGYTTLQLSRSASPLQLTRLPLRSVKALDLWPGVS